MPAGVAECSWHTTFGCRTSRGLRGGDGKRSTEALAAWIADLEGADDWIELPTTAAVLIDEDRLPGRSRVSCRFSPTRGREPLRRRCLRRAALTRALGVPTASIPPQQTETSPGVTLLLSYELMTTTPMPVSNPDGPDPA